MYIHSTARVFAIINSSVNVFIYGAFNKKFKDTFLSLFCKCCSIAKGNQDKTEKNNKTESTTAWKLKPFGHIRKRKSKSPLSYLTTYNFQKKSL